ncbi:hypothetical protein GCM10009560_11030 [Nonomuraea longicatena]|uniref:Uncharacterized protein n=1 Tax=Nonomuraea longicatena TaxID=83682 RepID=A0ABP3Z9W5_9ACTN
MPLRSAARSGGLPDSRDVGPFPIEARGGPTQQGGPRRGTAAGHPPTNEVHMDEVHMDMHRHAPKNRRTPQNSFWASGSGEQGGGPAAPRVHQRSLNYRQEDGAPVSRGRQTDE